jgi:recombination protein U
MNYPKGIKHENTKNNVLTSYGNRGMGLEEDINITNKYYYDNNIAFIYKKPTPIQISKIDYNNRGVIIKEAFFKEPSTTDYNGLYKGKYIDFDAKETKSKTSFPIANVHKHQINHIKNIVENDGIGFLIVRFTSLNKDFILLGEDLINYIEKSDRKSIPIEYFIEKGYLLDNNYMPRIDYLKVLDKIYNIGGYNG